MGSVVIFGLSNEVLWFAIGIMGLIVEVAIGGFWILFFGAGAILTAVLVWTGTFPDIDRQILSFVVSSTLMLILFRKMLVKSFGKKTGGESWNNPAGQIVDVVQEIPKQGSGRVEFQGSPWEALSEEGVSFPAGSKVKIARQEGLKLWVNKIEEN